MALEYLIVHVDTLEEVEPTLNDYATRGYRCIQITQDTDRLTRHDWVIMFEKET
jgi:hypothetical protein